MLEIDVVTEDDELIVSLVVKSEEGVPQIVGDIIEKNGYKTIVNEVSTR